MKSAPLLIAGSLFLLSCSAIGQSPTSDDIVAAPTAQDWTALGALPDLSGSWFPEIGDQKRQERGNEPPWKPEIKPQVEHWFAEEAAGRPRGVLVNCLPHGMPSFMLITHNAIEFLVTPGRLTILGESEGNRMRRIHTDGRAMPEDADPSFNGYSVGSWEGDTLVVETGFILPQTFLAVSEAVGIPNNGGMTVSERIHLVEDDLVAFDMVITAPEILTGPWETRRLYRRSRERSYEILEGVCRQGDFHEGTDEHGNAIYVPADHDGAGNFLPPE